MSDISERADRYVQKLFGPRPSAATGPVVEQQKVVQARAAQLTAIAARALNRRQGF
jgi:hypothetical protein